MGLKMYIEEKRIQLKNEKEAFIRNPVKTEANDCISKNCIIRNTVFIALS